MHWESSETLRLELPILKLTSEWITGFVDGEGCFHVGINPHKEMTARFQVLPEFTVVQHKRDVQLLEALKNFFQCGVVRTNHGDRLSYRVRSKDDLLKIIIPFFNKYPLQSVKRLDFELFRKILLIMERGDHLSPNGIEEIRSISGKMNRGMLR